MKRILSIAFLAMLTINALAKEKADTLVVTPTPQMHCANCENKIKSNIRFVKGTKKILTSVPNQTVTLIFDKNKCKFEDYVAAFKKIGYEIKKANSTPDKKSH